MNLVALSLIFFPTSSFQPENGEAANEARYFMTIFAFEGRPNVPRRAHTFAVFVKVQGGTSEVHTISWLPKSLVIAVLRRAPEPGGNLDLPQTLQLASSQGAVISQWGPYQVKADLYDRALRQIARLNSGKILFKAVDDGFRPDRAINCIHAVSDVAGTDPLLNTGTAFGAPASQMVFDHLRPWIIDERIRSEVNKVMGTAELQINQRK